MKSPVFGRQLHALHDSLALRNLRRRLETAVTCEDYISVLADIETWLPIDATAVDFPIFSVLPTTFEPAAKWRDQLKYYGLGEDVLGSLLQSGFVPVDRELLARGVLGDPFGTLGGEYRFLLIDPDYGVILFPRGLVARKNMILGVRTVMRYSAGYPILQRDQTAIFSIGAIRGHLAYHAHLSGNYYEPIDVTVSTREELDDLVARLHANIASRPWALWFRGQDREYLSADLVASAEAGVCPWRSFRDPSLVPSIFRTLARKVAEANWREVGNYLLDTGAFAGFIDERLRIPAYTLRDVEPEPVLGKQFGVSWTSTHSDAEEPPHDYHMTFRALQKMFFFQHYGLPSPVMDITRDLDVALFFANNRLDGRTYFPVGDDPARVIYIMVLEPDLDQFTNSEALCEHFHMLRPLRQKCGLISGATAIMRNFYARFVSVRVRLIGHIKHAEYSPTYLFPAATEDNFLAALVEYRAQHEITRVEPFILHDKLERKPSRKPAAPRKHKRKTRRPPRDDIP
jgi:FRG domain